ncbi:hypothetical protein [Maribacter sp. 2210JD10-5]|uniref:hypothetical protein n=1 Tax=Maribacter sp. 2210JD10-5 TaxID=3386272 RepID=UPI0039BD441F
MEKQGFYGANIFFAGRLWNGNHGLFLSDKKGNGKIKLYLDKDGNPRLELSDKNGKQISLSEIMNVKH